MNSSGVLTTGSRFESSSRCRARRRHADTGFAALSETLLLIVLTALLVVSVVATTRTSYTSVPSERTHVAAGESLWALAAGHPVAGLTTEKTADLIASMNGLADGRVEAGSVVRVPAQANSGLALACR